MRALLRQIRRFTRREAGTTTVEFVIVLPMVLALLFSSIDYGIVMLRQVFLDRAVDIAVRQVRLGNVSGAQYDNFRQLICDNTFLIADCVNSMAVEMHPVDTATWSGLDDDAQCVNREHELHPVVSFRPGTGAQELMLIRVCAVADPFIKMTGLILGMPEDESGGFFLVSHAAFANEPT
ncbi:pilus assembly protein [Rhodobacter sp. NTK016B]|uniref:TadE/TadG family type IV pilus assembly protein n=1 Tax=Rhodobacter sp. NTK016B TaxID=2759676 RepID=UPI001A8D3247|nr:TadE/TadG family type IV pilus assembly protein [Rhodobacter sp. NTK016B]MBN8291353.1 pilus assembly protein [Rhodobacter sp. NTK016B]